MWEPKVLRTKQMGARLRNVRDQKYFSKGSWGESQALGPNKEAYPSLTDGSFREQCKVAGS